MEMKGINAEKTAVLPKLFCGTYIGVNNAKQNCNDILWQQNNSKIHLEL